MAAYTPILFAQDIRRSAYRLPDTAQGFLCQARSLRLYTAQVGGQTERLKHGVQWFIASMACALRPRVEPHHFMVLTRVIMADASLVALGDTMEEGAFIPDDWISMFGLLVDALPYQVYTELMLEIFMPFTWWLKSWYSGRTTPKSTNPPAPIEAAIAAPVESQTLFLPSMDDSISDTSFDTKVKVHTKKRSRSVLAPIPPQSRKRVKREDGNQPTQENFSTGTPSAPAVTPLSVSLRVNRLLDSGAESPQKQSPQKISTRSNNVEKLIKQVHQLEQPSSPLVPDVWRVNSLSPLAVQSPVFAPSTPSGNPSSSGDPVSACSSDPVSRKSVPARTLKPTSSSSTTLNTPISSTSGRSGTSPTVSRSKTRPATPENRVIPSKPGRLTWSASSYRPEYDRYRQPRPRHSLSKPLLPNTPSGPASYKPALGRSTRSSSPPWPRKCAQ